MQLRCGSSKIKRQGMNIKRKKSMNAEMSNRSQRIGYGARLKLRDGRRWVRILRLTTAVIVGGELSC